MKRHSNTPAPPRSWQIWCGRVVSYVRFRPDHTAIRKELLAHLEDSCADFQRIGYDIEEAREKAVEAMGSAEEVGAALDKAHKPWLGWLWQATRAMILVLLIAIAVALIKSDGTVNDAWLRWQNQLTWTEPASGADRVETEHATLWLAPGAVTEQDGYTHAEFHLWMETKTPVDLSYGTILSYVEISDDQGFVPMYERNEDYVWPESGYWKSGGTYTSWTRYRWNFELVQEHAPQWVELRYPYGGSGWTLRAEWEAAE